MALVVVLTGCASTPKEPLLTAQQRQLNVESFELAWSRVNEQYWDPTFGGVDWRAVHDELGPQIEQAATMSAARDVMYDMVSRLGVSHFGFVPTDISAELGGSGGDSPEDGVTGIDLRVIDGHALVTSVRGDSPAAQAGVQPGWEIMRIGEIDVAAKLKTLTEKLKDDPKTPLRLTYGVMERLYGRVGDTIAVAFRDGDDETVALDIPLAPRQGRIVKFGDIPNIEVWIEVERLADNIGYIAFNCFFDPRQMQTFNEAMESFMDADGIIIDLRGNPGGMGAMAMGMVGWLVAGEGQYLGTMQLRNNELKMVVQPRPQTYAGPVAVLVDGLSGSASECFSGGLQDLGRACIVGSRTKGEALPAQLLKLPNDDVFFYATANYVTVGGRVLEGAGVTPDIEVQPTRAALLAGKDPALDAAIGWIREQQ